jgi:hypothetical protein
VHELVRWHEELELELEGPADREVYFVQELVRWHQEDELDLERNANCFLVHEMGRWHDELGLERNPTGISSWRRCVDIMKLNCNWRGTRIVSRGRLARRTRIRGTRSVSRAGTGAPA